MRSRYLLPSTFAPSSKTAAIYVQEFPDTIALDAVNEITSLTNGLSRNIWQKIMLLDRMDVAGVDSRESTPTPISASSNLFPTTGSPPDGASS